MPPARNPQSIRLSWGSNPRTTETALQQNTRTRQSADSNLRYQICAKPCALKSLFSSTVAFDESLDVTAVSKHDDQRETIGPGTRKQAFDTLSTEFGRKHAAFCSDAKVSETFLSYAVEENAER